MIEKEGIVKGLFPVKNENIHGNFVLKQRKTGIVATSGNEHLSLT